MDNYRIIKKRQPATGLRFRFLRRNHVAVYINAGMQRQLEDFQRDGWCNVYAKNSSMMIQITNKPVADSRHIRHSCLSLPLGLIKEYWPDGIDYKIIPATVEKGSIIVADLRDLRS